MSVLTGGQGEITCNYLPTMIGLRRIGLDWIDWIGVGESRSGTVVCVLIHCPLHEMLYVGSVLRCGEFRHFEIQYMSREMRDDSRGSWPQTMVMGSLGV